MVNYEIEIVLYLFEKQRCPDLCQFLKSCHSREDGKQLPIMQNSKIMKGI